MTRDPNAEGANPFADRERHTVSITRMCLRSGSVQLPFALMDRLPEGEVLAVDTEKSEAMVLWSTPPRSLQGLAPLFAAHEVQVNDQLVLEPRDEELRVTVQKRPRRSRPKVQASTWSSVRDDAPQRTQGATPEGEGAAGDPWDPDRAAAGGVAPGWEDASFDRAPGGTDQDGSQRVQVQGAGQDDGAWEVPAVGREGPEDGAEGGRLSGAAREAGGSRGRSADDRRGEEASGGWLGGMVRRARGMFGGSGRQVEDDPDASSPPQRDAWARAWNDPREDDPIAPPWQEEDPPLTHTPQTAQQDEREPRRAAPQRPAPREAAPREREPGEAEAPATAPRDSAPDPADRRGPEPGAPARARDLAPPDEPSLRFGPDPDFSRGAFQDEPPAPAEPVEVEEEKPVGRAAREAADAEANAGPAANREATPSRAEKFLGGDLRTRLLRHLTAPDAPVIAGYESIAERFDLEPAMALELLDDIAADPPPGLRLTRIREGTYRLERKRS